MDVCEKCGNDTYVCVFCAKVKCAACDGSAPIPHRFDVWEHHGNKCPACTAAPLPLAGLRGMPRRVFTYPADIGWDLLNLMSTVGAFIFAGGFAIVVVDVLRPKHRQPRAPQNVRPKPA